MIVRPPEDVVRVQGRDQTLEELRVSALAHRHRQAAIVEIAAGTGILKPRCLLRPARRRWSGCFRRG